MAFRSRSARSRSPHLVDHSAYDAYALSVEADGQRILYSGDLRAHGRSRRRSSAWSSARPMTSML